MNKMKKAMYVLMMMVMSLAFAATAQAAGCTCQGSSKPHSDSDHQKEYLQIDNDASSHEIICWTCIENGHSTDCAQVLLGTEAHTFISTKNGSKVTKECSKCGYKTEEECQHENARWTEIYPTSDTQTDETTCVKYCSDCRKVVETKAHAWTYKQKDTDRAVLSDTALKKHDVVCSDCGYARLGGEEHTLKTTYKKMAAQKNFALLDNKSPAVYHTVTETCTKCGFTQTYYEEHTFKSGKCKKCKLKKEILTKVTGAKGTQLTAVKRSTLQRPAEWYYTGKKWIYRPAGTYEMYTTTVKIKWKKKKGAYGYMYSVNKGRLKAGRIIDDEDAAGTGNTGFTRKTSTKVGLSPTKTSSGWKAVLYVAPVSKYGYIGKVKKITINLS